LKGLSFLLPYICQTMETCYSNNLKEHFMTRLFRYINIVGGKYYDETIGKNKEQNKDYIKEKRKILYQLKKAINNKEEIQIEFKQWYDDKKNTIFPIQFEKSIAYDCKVSPSKYIIYSINMNAEYEKLNELIENEIKKKQQEYEISKDEEIKKEIVKINSSLIKLFQPLSLRKSHVPHYINLDTACLMNMFSEKGKKGENLQALKDNKEKIWKEIFKMDHNIFKQNRDYIFNYTMQTDGIACSLLFRHISIKDKKYGGKTKKIIDEESYIDDLSDEQLENLKNKKIVAGDPGKYNMTYMVDDEGNKLRYTCAQRDTESLAKKNRQIMKQNKITDKIVALETELSMVTSRTVNFEKFKEFIKKKYEVGQKVKKFYEKEICRKLKWRTQTNRRKSEDNFLNRIEEKFGSRDDFLIVYGDWSRDTQMKYHVPTMGKGLRKIISKRFLLVLINEFNTSKKCCNCWKDNENYYLDGEKKFRILTCKDCEVNIGSLESKKCPMFITRDLNSCVNMISIAKNIIYKKGRPVEFCREQNN